MIHLFFRTSLVILGSCQPRRRAVTLQLIPMVLALHFLGIHRGGGRLRLMGEAA